MNYHIVYQTTCIPTGKVYIGVHSQRLPPFEFDGYLGSGLLLNRAIEKYSEHMFKRETLFIFLTAEEAYAKEQELVDINFILDENTFNIALGGTGGFTTAKYSRGERSAIALKSVATKRLNGSLNFTDEHKQNISTAAKIRAAKGHIPNNVGRVHVGNVLENIKQAGRTRRGKYIRITDGRITVTHNAIRPIPPGWERGVGSDIPRFVAHSEESKQKIANNKNIRGVVCYTDGIVNLKLQPGETPPDGFRLGMTQKHSKRWITDGSVSKCITKDEQIPEGWKPGRIINWKKGNPKNE
jgi:hypothetical protein